MEKNRMDMVDAESWQEWKEACSIENCKEPTTVDQLASFGRNRLGNALRRYSPETAELYCTLDNNNTQRAWLKVEQYLYAGASKKQEREGKAYKDMLLEGYASKSHFEAILTLKIKREITRWILAEECFDIVQKKDPETGRKKYVVTRAQSMSDNLDQLSIDLDDLQSDLDGIYMEPASPEDEDAVMKAATYHAFKLWQTLDTPKNTSLRLILVCFLNSIWDMKTILSSGLIDCKQSQLYSIRKKIIDLIDAVDWGSSCVETRQRAYMTRRMLPELHKICTKWLESAENEKVKLFIDMAGCEVLP